MPSGQPPGNVTHGNEGIQQLLAAEKRAAEKVAEARKRKVRRLKQANEEAQLEINAYRIAREQAYERFEKAHAGNKEDVSAQIDKDIEEYIRTVDKMVQENKEKVTAELVELVFNITPAVHPNFYVLKAFNQI
uniref:V-type proton ATPase subunit G n=1 Tax=Dendroctonus ponderosae TaxID=77166 RepID=A0AAR5Q394_DENPD